VASAYLEESLETIGGVVLYLYEQRIFRFFQIEPPIVRFSKSAGGAQQTAQYV
jgi:hypothetical protein